MELIDAPGEDCYICLCGNAPHYEGLYPCDRAGQVVEPDQNWPGLYICGRCGRIVDANTYDPATNTVQVFRGPVLEDRSDGG